MSRIIAYDFARLFIGPIFHTPRGIDRVDLAMARHVFDDDNSPNLGVLPTPWGVRVFPARVVRGWLASLQKRWAEDLDIQHDTKLHGLIGQLRSHHTAPSRDDATDEVPPARAMSLARNVGRILNQFRSNGIHLGQSAIRAVPRGATYLNIGQLGLAIPIFHNWLTHRTDITCAIMLHDAIPLDFPHLVPSGAEAHHARMIKTAARHADCLIFNSIYSQECVDRAMERLEQVRLPGMVRTLPLPTAFVEVRNSLPELSDTHYFVVVSTIEPRKNHTLLIRVWERIMSRMGDQAPHLIIVGSRGYDAERILAPLDTHPTLRQRIHVVSGLSSPALAALVLGASGMLCPTFTEGFGLPVLEANAMGVMTIASDIPAHREVGNNSTIYLPCDDEIAWAMAILAVPPVKQRIRPPIPLYLTESSYCSDIFNFLLKLKNETR